jgi:8-oxo-dGTP pyrophosphatase MutT (NUDIX family)
MSINSFSEQGLRRFFASYQRTEISRLHLRRAAVLIPLVEERSDIVILFTRRTDEVEHHKGQISFPGGVVDPEDLSLVATALREAEEEIGLSPTDVRVLGICSDFSTPSGFNIAPVVGYVKTLPPLRLHAVEVAEILTVPLSFFLDPANRKASTEIHDGHPRHIIRYFFDHYEIWGATAAMLTAFIDAVLGGTTGRSST